MSGRIFIVVEPTAPLAPIKLGEEPTPAVATTAKLAIPFPAVPPKEVPRNSKVPPKAPLLAMPFMELKFRMLEAPTPAPGVIVSTPLPF